ncbi:MAG: AraC family transcriptional regulator [Anaerolineaceae bacterium]|nr:AraC family transcriptional regulator [Anaerolineaceae bacterium]
MSESVFIPKHPLLQQVVEYFWTLEGTPSSDDDATLIYPESCFEIILSFDAATRWVSGDHETLLPRSFITPIRTSYYDIHPQGHVEYLAIRFRPAIMPFISMPADMFENRAIALDDVLENKFRHMIEPVFSMDNMPERISFLEETLTQWLIKGVPARPPAFQHAVSMLHHSFGQSPIQMVCEESGLYPRKLERQFNQYMGVSPKTYARILRFNFAIQQLLTVPITNSTEMAFQAGYSDQAHFIRECREFTGRTPGELRSM